MSVLISLSDNQLYLNQDQTKVVKLRNLTKGYVGFKIRSTHPSEFISHPNSGLLNANAEIDLKITLKEIKPNENYKLQIIGVKIDSSDWREDLEKNIKDKPTTILKIQANGAKSLEQSRRASQQDIGSQYEQLEKELKQVRIYREEAYSNLHTTEKPKGNQIIYILAILLGYLITNIGFKFYEN